jgi:lysophospholipase L1-like esterase
LADSDTTVICALGDSITDGGTTANGHDGWSDALSRRLHRLYGDKVSVVNMAIGGNTIVANTGGSEPVVKRLDRDVLRIAGLTSVIWLEGINDLGSGRLRVDEITQGIRLVVGRLRERGISVVGATLTSSMRPRNSPLDESQSWRRLLDAYHEPRVDDGREQLNRFISRSKLFDDIADMSLATTDPKTGALYEEMHIGDYLHPNRVGHLAMAGAIQLDSLVPPVRRTHPTNGTED